MFLCVGLLARVSGNSEGLSRNDGYCEGIVLVPRTVDVPLPCCLSVILGSLQAKAGPHAAPQSTFTTPGGLQGDPPAQSYHMLTHCHLPSDHGGLVRYSSP